jgi:hypothetical protein
LEWIRSCYPVPTCYNNSAQGSSEGSYLVRSRSFNLEYDVLVESFVVRGGHYQSYHPSFSIGKVSYSRDDKGILVSREDSRC